MRHLVPVLVLGAAISAPPAGAQEPPPQALLEKIAATSASKGPVPIGTDDDVYCSGYVGDPDETFAGSIIDGEMSQSQTLYFEGDIVYLNIGSAQGAVAGQEFTVVRPGRLVYPARHQGFAPAGRFYETPARLRILCAQENTSISEIVSSCLDVEVGDRIAPFEPIPIPLVRRTPRITSCDPASGKVTGQIMEMKGFGDIVGQDTVVYLDRGEDDGLIAGDFMTVFRTTDDPSEFIAWMGDSTQRPRQGDEGVVRIVRTILGEVAVLKTGPRTSVAKVVNMRESMRLGDKVELK